MFSKLVAIEPVSLIPSAEKALQNHAKEVILYPDIPQDDDEIVRRIGDADAVLVSYTSNIGRNVMERCPGIRYIGMCCSLYSPESANVDIRYAEERGITVKGIRDYGDEGVVEYRERTGPLPTRIRPTGMGRRSPRNYRTESRHRGIGQVGRHDSRRFEIFRGGNFLFRP